MMNLEKFCRNMAAATVHPRLWWPFAACTTFPRLLREHTNQYSALLRFCHALPSYCDGSAQQQHHHTTTTTTQYQPIT